MPVPGFDIYLVEVERRVSIHSLLENVLFVVTSGVSLGLVIRPTPSYLFWRVMFHGEAKDRIGFYLGLIKELTEWMRRRLAEGLPPWTLQPP